MTEGSVTGAPGLSSPSPMFRKGGQITEEPKLPIIAHEFFFGEKTYPRSVEDSWRVVGKTWWNFFEVYGKAMQMCDGHRHIANDDS